MNGEGPVLRDIHLPPAAWWPPAPGWWLLAVLVIAIGIGAAWWMRERARSGPLHAALQEIDAIESAYAITRDNARLADQCSRLLRRIARHIDAGTASRTGIAWHAFLRRYARDAATWQALEALAMVRFNANPALDAQALLPALRRWSRDALRGKIVRHAEIPAAARGIASP